jgi:hypothetical protein
MPLVYSNSIDDNNLRNNSPLGQLRLIAFFILHGTSHNAGFRHKCGCGDEGYAMDGTRIQQLLIEPNSEINTFEKLILYTKKEYNHVIESTKIRFGIR